MTDAGNKIIAGLKDALAGNFAAVTIEGQRWVRAPNPVAKIVCPQCHCGAELWWSYCAMCGYHIASGRAVQS